MPHLFIYWDGANRKLVSIPANSQEEADRIFEKRHGKISRYSDELIGG